MCVNGYWDQVFPPQWQSGELMMALMEPTEKFPIEKRSGTHKVNNTRPWPYSTREKAVLSMGTSNSPMKQVMNRRRFCDAIESIPPSGTSPVTLEAKAP